MVINGSCSTNMCARQLSFNFSSMVWGGGIAPWPPLWIRPWLVLIEDTCWRNVEFALERKERLAQTSRMVQQYTMLSR